MNTRDLAQQKAYEMLQELGIRTDSVIETSNGMVTALSIATCGFLRGWVHGLQDSKEIRRRTLTDPKASYISLLRRQAG